MLSKKGQVETMAVADLRRATVLTDTNAHVWLASAGSATAVLVPITLTTGGFVWFLMPTVGFAGVLAMGIIWAESRVVLRKKELLLLYQYARWPQGKPRPKQEAPPKPEPAPQAPAPEPEPIEPVPAPDRSTKVTPSDRAKARSAPERTKKASSSAEPKADAPMPLE